MGYQNFQQFFPCLPDYMDWEAWNGNLAIYYGQKNIKFADEENWKEGAYDILKSQTFNTYPVPLPDTYETWQEWANEFTTVINGPSR